VIFLVFLTFPSKEWGNVLNYLHGWFIIISDQVELCHCTYFKLSKDVCHFKNSLVWYWSCVRILLLQERGVFDLLQTWRSNTLRSCETSCSWMDRNM